MGYSEELEMSQHYWRLRTVVEDVIEGVESGDINFEEAIEKLKDEVE